MWRHYSFIFIFCLYSFISFGQELKYTEAKDKAKDITYKGAEDKAMLIFKTDLDLTFEASNDPLSTISKNNGEYIIPIYSGDQLVTIKSLCCGRRMLNFVFGDLGVLKPREIRYFIIEKSNIVGGIADITKEEKAKGTSDFPGYNEKDGFLFFYISAIPNIELLFNEKNGYVTKVTKDADRYQLYAKSGVPIELTISAKGYDDLTYNIDTLGVKGVKYFRLYSLKNSEKTTTSDNSLKKGSYKIVTDPPGATLELDGNPYFNKQPESERTTPYSLADMKSGPQIISISLNKYETIIDTIYIGNDKNISRYTLIPTISHIRFNITPVNAEVSIDGNKIPSYQGTDIEVNKGSRYIEIKAPHYNSESFNLQTFANQIHTVYKKLIPIKGYLTINKGVNADDANCYIESKELGISRYKIGSLPINDFVLQEGEYIVTFEKKGFASEENEYKINIHNNKTSIIKLNMVNAISINITTAPNGANIYIDDKLVGTSNLKTKLGIGSHSIKIEKDNYETKSEKILISENDNTPVFSYTLIPKLISVTFHTSPSGVYVNGDGLNFNISDKSLTKSIAFGQYKVAYSKKGFFDKNKIINVKENGDEFNAKLFPSSFGQFGVSYGLDMLYLNLNGCIHKHFWLGASIGGNMKEHKFSNPINVTNANVDDISTYNAIGTINDKNSKDSAGGAWCVNVKLGWFFQKPFYFILNVGYAGMKSQAYQNVYQAKHGYVSTTGNTIINTGDYFTGSKGIVKGYNSFTLGIYIPLSRKFYIGADYYLKSEVGPGLVYTAGFIIH